MEEQFLVGPPPLQVDHFDRKKFPPGWTIPFTFGPKFPEIFGIVGSTKGHIPVGQEYRSVLHQWITYPYSFPLM